MRMASEFVSDMIDLAARGLPHCSVGGQFVFTRRGRRRADGTWTVVPEGRSVRYAAIVALGAATIPEERQRKILNGDTARDLCSRLIEELPRVGALGDAALICWAAAETGHPHLDVALRRLTEVDDRPHTVDQAWRLSALVAAARVTGDTARVETPRERLLDGLRQDRLYRHVLGSATPWYRAHVGCFADQVYPLQALARLHALAGDAEALAAAERVATGICEAQGPDGQWWWHYDARSGAVVEGYPVYSVHQLAMAPMALLDLRDAGGSAHLGEIALGLRWMIERPETDEALVVPELDLTWRKAARADPRKLVRGVRATASRLHQGARLAVLDRVYPPRAIDRECRPYELGWLLYAWMYGT